MISASLAADSLENADLLENADSLEHEPPPRAERAVDVEPAQGALRRTRVLRCHADFVVLAIGLPQPAYAGNPLDPPLRSRFSCRRLRVDSGADALASVRAHAPRLSLGVANSLVATVDALRLRSAAGERFASAADIFSATSALSAS